MDLENPLSSPVYERTKYGLTMSLKYIIAGVTVVVMSELALMCLLKYPPVYDNSDSGAYASVLYAYILHLLVGAFSIGISLLYLLADLTSPIYYSILTYVCVGFPNYIMLLIYQHKAIISTLVSVYYVIFYVYYTVFYSMAVLSFCYRTYKQRCKREALLTDTYGEFTYNIE